MAETENFKQFNKIAHIFNILTTAFYSKAGVLYFLIVSWNTGW